MLLLDVLELTVCCCSDVLLDVEFWCQDYVSLLPSLAGRQDAVFVDPPWGGPDFFRVKKLTLKLSSSGAENAASDPNACTLPELCRRVRDNDRRVTSAYAVAATISDVSAVIAPVVAPHDPASAASAPAEGDMPAAAAPSSSVWPSPLRRCNLVMFKLPNNIDLVAFARELSLSSLTSNAAGVVGSPTTVASRKCGLQDEEDEHKDGSGATMHAPGGASTATLTAQDSTPIKSTSEATNQSSGASSASNESHLPLLARIRLPKMTLLAVLYAPTLTRVDVMRMMTELSGELSKKAGAQKYMWRNEAWKTIATDGDVQEEALWEVVRDAVNTGSSAHSNRGRERSRRSASPRRSRSRSRSPRRSRSPHRSRSRSRSHNRSRSRSRNRSRSRGRHHRQGRKHHRRSRDRRSCSRSGSPRRRFHSSKKERHGGHRQVDGDRGDGQPTGYH